MGQRPITHSHSRILIRRTHLRRLTSRRTGPTHNIRVIRIHRAIQVSPHRRQRNLTRIISVLRIRSRTHHTHRHKRISRRIHQSTHHRRPSRPISRNALIRSHTSQPPIITRPHSLHHTNSTHRNRHLTRQHIKVSRTNTQRIRTRRFRRRLITINNTMRHTNPQQVVKHRLNHRRHLTPSLSNNGILTSTNLFIVKRAQKRQPTQRRRHERVTRNNNHSRRPQRSLITSTRPSNHIRSVIQRNRTHHRHSRITKGRQRFRPNTPLNSTITRNKSTTHSLNHNPNHVNHATSRIKVIFVQTVNQRRIIMNNSSPSIKLIHSHRVNLIIRHNVNIHLITTQRVHTTQSLTHHANSLIRVNHTHLNQPHTSTINSTVSSKVRNRNNLSQLQPAGEALTLATRPPNHQTHGQLSATNKQNCAPPSQAKSRT